MSPTFVTVQRTLIGRDGAGEGRRAIPEEAAIALTYNGSSHAVMMATPADFEDFAIGFSLTEGIIETADEIEQFDVVEEANGIELRMRLAASRAERLAARRRYLAGPVGCGLCGVDSLEDAMRALPRVAATREPVSPDTIFTALAAMDRAQVLNRETHAVHAAAFFTEAQGLVAVREDVGRHNALDKLVGALARAEIAPRDGFVIVTSRLSYDLVQKVAMVGVPILVAVSAPTALAVRAADASNITLVAVARRDSLEVFTHATRIVQKAEAHVGC
jgi:FdhD protein